MTQPNGAVAKNGNWCWEYLVAVEMPDGSFTIELWWLPSIGVAEDRGKRLASVLGGTLVSVEQLTTVGDE